MGNAYRLPNKRNSPPIQGAALMSPDRYPWTIRFCAPGYARVPGWRCVSVPCFWPCRVAVRQLLPWWSTRCGLNPRLAWTLTATRCQSHCPSVTLRPVAVPTRSPPIPPPCRIPRMPPTSQVSRSKPTPPGRRAGPTCSLATSTFRSRRSSSLTASSRSGRQAIATTSSTCLSVSACRALWRSLTAPPFGKPRRA